MAIFLQLFLLNVTQRKVPQMFVTVPNVLTVKLVKT